MIRNNQNHLHSTLLLKTPYGNEYIDEPVLIELINSFSMQRLKKINQYGISAYVTNIPSFSRYDHSIGVMVLLKKYDCSLHEQIAGLLHDVSHTVFSHVADSVFNHQSEKNSYQDDIHEWFINKTELPEILNNYGFCVKDILHKQKQFAALEQDLPHICADRLEYNLRGAYVEKMIDQKQIKKILDGLQFQNGYWFFSNQKLAKIFADTSLYLQQYAYTSSLSCIVYYWTAQVLRRALILEEISVDEIHFSIDKKILQKLKQSADPQIAKLLKKIFNPTAFFKQGTVTDFDLKFPVKFRGIDPWIKTKNGIHYLSELDEIFAKKYNQIKHYMKNGWYIKL